MRHTEILASTILRSNKLWNNYLMPKMPSPFYFPLAFRWQPLKQYLDVEKHAGMYLPLNRSFSVGYPQWSPMALEWKI